MTEVIEVIGDKPDAERFECFRVERVAFFESLDGSAFAVQFESAGGVIHRYHFPASAYYDLAHALSASRATSEAFARRVRN